MTVRRVERELRTAFSTPSPPPADVPAPMPPHIQWAEWRTEPGTGHTDYRCGPRTLVVRGSADATWPLTGDAAHATDRTDGPVGSSLGSAVDGNATVPVTGLLMAAAQPLETRYTAHQQHTNRELAGPIRLTGGLASTRQQLTPAAAESRPHLGLVSGTPAGLT
ncbi:MAG TPA: hypothetical protein VGB74_05260 [Actinoplanes sp.]|jgi:hypothetical protein